MRALHPTLPAGQFADFDEASFEALWQHRGWLRAPSVPDLSEKTRDEILELVGDDPTLAAVALAEEAHGRHRSSVMAPLRKIADPAADVDVDPLDPGDEPLTAETFAGIEHESQAQVLRLVGKDPARAAAALAAEQATDEPRERLVHQLSRLAGQTA